MGDTELVLAYPGLWLRADIYATHGHYLDCHNHAATFECLARRATEKLLREPRHGYRTPDDYEAVLQPLYRAIYRVAQSQRARVLARSAKAMVRWRGWPAIAVRAGGPACARWRRSWNA